jgi:hypothetical protein
VADTLGSLIDKLAITNIKLFMVQDVIHEAEKCNDGVDATVVHRLVTLNKQRNRLMEEIDRVGGGEVEERIKF